MKNNLIKKENSLNEFFNNISENGNFSKKFKFKDMSFRILSGVKIK